MKTKIWIASAACLILLVGGAGAYWYFANHRELRFPGVVEVQEVRLASKVGGRIEDVLIREGDLVDPSKPLVVFEAPELRNQWKQVKARLYLAEAELKRALVGPRPEEKAAAKAARDAAKAKWERAEKGWREEEIDQIRSKYKSAQAEYDQALKEFIRIAGLYSQRSISRSEYDAAMSYRDRTKGVADAASFELKMVLAGARPEDKAEAKAEYRRAKANFELLNNGTRQEDKDIAQAKVDELQRQLEAIEINLKETELRVPPHLGKAMVEVIAVRPGDVVPANQSVIRVLRTEDMWVKIFVPETQYGLVTHDKPVTVTIDSHPGKIFKGKIIQRSNISEFTPRNVQSVDERRHQVFGVKIRVEDAAGIFNAGMAAEVRIPLD